MTEDLIVVAYYAYCPNVQIQHSYYSICGALSTFTRRIIMVILLGLLRGDAFVDNAQKVLIFQSRSHSFLVVELLVDCNLGLMSARRYLHNYFKSHRQHSQQFYSNR